MGELRHPDPAVRGPAGRGDESRRSLREQLELGRGGSGPGFSAGLLLGVLALQLVMIGSYVGALHQPKVEDVPVAVVAPGGKAGPLTAALARGGAIDPRPVADESAARRAIDDREVYAALLPGVRGDRLVVAPAASTSVAEILPAALRAATPPRTLQVETVRALPEDDPRGLSPFYLVVGWLVGGYVGAAVLGLARGAPPTRRDVGGRLGALAVYAVASGLLGTLVVQQIVGVLEGSTLALAAAGALVVFATGAATAALQGLLGIAGTGLAILLFVALGNPSSGGPLATDLLMPEPWRVVGPLLPPGAGTELARNIAYFDGNALGGPILVLVGWAAIGMIGMGLAARRHRTTEPEALAGAAFAT